METFLRWSELIMSNIHLEPFDETYLRVHCDDGLAMELHEFFTFKAKDFQFHPLVKKGKWNGDIYLFNLKTRRIYRGLIDYLKDFCESRDYSLEISPKLDEKKNAQEQGKIALWLNDGLRPTDEQGRRIQFRDAQIRAVSEVIWRDRVLLLSPTSSGKSIIAYALVRIFQRKESMKGKKTLIIVPTTGLVHQMAGDFKSYSLENGWDVDKNVHKVYSGQDKNVSQQVIVSTWQSLMDMPAGYFKQFGAVICDEVHLATAQSIKTIMENLTESKYRVGMTGTLDDCQTHHLVLTGLFGKIIRVDHTYKMMERGEVANLEIQMLFLKHPQESCLELEKIKREPYNKNGVRFKKSPTIKYQDEMEYIAQNKKRNLFVKNLALNLKGNTLVLFKYVEKHGQQLYDLILTDAKEERKVFFIHGGVDGSDRDEIRAIVEKEKDAVIIASYGTFSTGTSIRNLHNMVLAMGSKSKVQVLQSLGRMLRKSDTKDSAVVYDLCDDMTYNGNPNFVLEHALERADIYAREHFKYTIHKLNL